MLKKPCANRVSAGHVPGRHPSAGHKCLNMGSLRECSCDVTPQGHTLESCIGTQISLWMPVWRDVFAALRFVAEIHAGTICNS